MRHKKMTALVLTSFMSYACFGQEVSEKRILISDVNIQSNLTTQVGIPGSLQDFKGLAPTSALLNSNFSGFTNYGSNVFSSSNGLNISLGLALKNKQKMDYKSKPLLRLGVGYFNQGDFFNYYTKTTSSPYDTLTSTSSGQSIYLDSIHNETYSMNYKSQQLRFDASLIFRTNKDARWSLFGGIGFNAGLSINATTTVSYITTESTTNVNPNNTGSISPIMETYATGNKTQESFRNKANVGMSAYLPLGVDFRIGKKREFWKRLHLYYELRPAVSAASIPELRTFTIFTMQQGLGLRITLN